MKSSPQPLVSAIAVQDETYEIVTPYGRKHFYRKRGEILEPALLSPSELENTRRGMTEYNFVAQFQQDPQPPSGIIVKRESLKLSGGPESLNRISASISGASAGVKLPHGAAAR